MSRSEKQENKVIQNPANMEDEELQEDNSWLFFALMLTWAVTIFFVVLFVLLITDNKDNGLFTLVSAGAMTVGSVLGSALWVIYKFNKDEIKDRDALVRLQEVDREGT